MGLATMQAFQEFQGVFFVTLAVKNVCFLWKTSCIGEIASLRVKTHMKLLSVITVLMVNARESSRALTECVIMMHYKLHCISRSLRSQHREILEGPTKTSVPTVIQQWSQNHEMWTLVSFFYFLHSVPFLKHVNKPYRIPASVSFPAGRFSLFWERD